MKGGLGWHAVEAGGLRVGAVVAVNALGDILDPSTGEVLAGLLDEGRCQVLDTEQAMIATVARSADGAQDATLRGTRDVFAGNTTLGVVLTNARLTKAQCGKLASMAHDGLARAMRPAHSMVDGDTIFALASGHLDGHLDGPVDADLSIVGLLAARAVERAIVSGIRHATSLGGVPASRDLAG
jgi:L-aminopeptidase/D-esterase-like protein